MINTYKLLGKNAKIMVISKNNFGLDSVVYYQKYVNFNYNPKNITFVLEKYNISEKLYIKTEAYSKSVHIYPITIANPLNNNNLEKLLSKLEKYDFILLDLNILIPELFDIRTNYNFQAILSRIIVSLKTLNKGGNMILFIWNITNKMVLDTIMFIAGLFTESFVCQEDIYSDAYTYYNRFIFKGYNGIQNLDNLLELNKMNYTYDPTGGYNYQVVNKNERNMFKNNYESLNPPTKYLNNIIKIEGDYTDFYKKYKEYMVKIYEDKLERLFEIKSLHLNYQNEKYINELNRKALLFSINYAKNSKLHIVEWIKYDKINNKYYETILNNFRDNIKPELHLLKKLKIIDTLKITQNNELVTPCKNIEIIYHQAENTYKCIF